MDHRKQKGRKTVRYNTPVYPLPVLTKKKQSTQSQDGDDERRWLSYFGHRDDGRCTLRIRNMKLPTFMYNFELPVSQRNKYPEEEKQQLVFEKLRVESEHNLERFLVAPERKNVWMGGIRSQCEGVLTAKSYKSTNEDRGAYTVIPWIEGSGVTVEAVYKMWLALECAMIRRESLVIVEDPALAHVTKLRTEQWRLMNRFVKWGCAVSILFATFTPRHSTFYLFPFCFAYYGLGMLRGMSQRDPSSRYSECCINKQYEQDPDSHTVCDAQISLKYLRCPRYKMFKLENHRTRNKRNSILVAFTMTYGIIAMIRNIYSFNYCHHMVKRGFDPPNPTKPQPLNIFEQLRKRFFTFGNAPEPGRVDLIHWIIQNGLFYFFVLRHIPWIIQICLEYFEREYIMEASIRYLQFRNLQGEEQYEFPARNLYRTMQKDFPSNRILKEMYEHYEPPPEYYYESEEFRSTREPHKVTLKEALRRWKIAYYRNW